MYTKRRYERIKIVFLIFLLHASCAVGHHVMTMDSYTQVPIGLPVNELKKTAGKPYSIRHMDEGKDKYEYIERIFMGDKVIEERHYYFIIKDGRVVSKQIQEEKPPPFQVPNSYEMQTS